MNTSVLMIYAKIMKIYVYFCELLWPFSRHKYLNSLLDDFNAAVVICFRLKHVMILNCAILAICVLMAIFLPKIGTIIR